MHYDHVCLEAFGYTLPDEILTSDHIEQRLEPLYERLSLPAGRLELMTGIQARRVWPRGTLPGDISIQSAEKALRVSGIERSRIGALIHGSVCRDHLEPATACRVHHALNLPASCAIYDVSNACLGLLSGAVQIANMIELNQIEAGLVVGTEGSRQLLEHTIEHLNTNTELTRRSIKSAVASLTIGSASCAMLLTHKDISRTGNRLTTAVTRANTQYHDLCHSGQDEAGDQMQPLMDTDSERLMKEGIATGVATFRDFLPTAGWSVDEVHKSFCHQVGSAHRRMMLDALGIPEQRDFHTLEWLGNTGSVALPTTMAIGLQRGHVQPGDNVGMLGIGSGINSVMLGVEWQKTLVSDEPVSVVPQRVDAPENATRPRRPRPATR